MHRGAARVQIPALVRTVLAGVYSLKITAAPGVRAPFKLNAGGKSEIFLFCFAVVSFRFPLLFKSFPFPRCLQVVLFRCGCARQVLEVLLSLSPSPAFLWTRSQAATLTLLLFCKSFSIYIYIYIYI